VTLSLFIFLRPLKQQSVQQEFSAAAVLAEQMQRLQRYETVMQIEQLTQTQRRPVNGVV
jgi:hypothetical protein